GEAGVVRRARRADVADAQPPVRAVGGGVAVAGHSRAADADLARAAARVVGAHPALVRVAGLPGRAVAVVVTVAGNARSVDADVRAAVFEAAALVGAAVAADLRLEVADLSVRAGAA